MRSEQRDLLALVADQLELALEHAEQVLPALLLRVEPLEALERLQVARVLFEHALVLLDRQRLVADAILVGLGQLELRGQRLLAGRRPPAPCA